METYEAIMTRRSTRNFKSDAVEQDKLEKILNAGRLAPSGRNNQWNHFFVITDSNVIGELAKIVEQTFAKMEITEYTYESIKNSILRSQKGGYVYSYNAPILIIVANKKNYGNNIADCAVAIENMMIMANDIGLGSCWINQLKWLNEEPTLIEYMKKLGMNEDERVYGSMVIGYPATKDGKPNRNPLERKGNEVTYIS